MEDNKNIKKYIIAGGAVVALVLAGIVGGSISSNNSAKETPTPDYTVVEPEPVEPISLDEQYLFAVHYADNYIVESNTDADLIAIGKQTCDTLDTGLTVQDLMFALVADADGSESDAYWEFAGIIIGAGVATYCPEYSYQIG